MSLNSTVYNNNIFCKNNFLILEKKIFFFNCYLAVPWPTLGHSQGDNPTNPMLITAAFVQVRLEGCWEPHNERYL